jgi:hypothetical protein
MSDIDEDDDDGEVGLAVSRNNRGSKGVTELHYFVLALSLSELPVNNKSMSPEQQFEMMALNCDRWIGLLKSEFGQIHRQFMSKGSVEWTRISPSGYATQVYKVLQAAL